MNPLLHDPIYPEQTRKPIIVALDFPDANQTLQFVRQLNPHSCRLKIGKELFTASGRQLAEQLIHQGFDLFLDLKYHDIPNTVAQACRVAADIGVWMLDVHTTGGRRMMQEAANALAAYRQRPLLIGVTVLTSLEQSELDEIGWQMPIEQLVLHQAKLAQSSGLDGVVCSAREASLLRQHIGQDFVLVTPGIRFDTSPSDDQRRTLTPEQAIAAGSSHLVIGRPITRASDPAAVIEHINRSLQVA